MGLVLLLGLGVVALALMRLFGLPRKLWALVGAALMLGATGYALQGSPDQGASPARAAIAPPLDDPALTDLRDRMLGRYTLDAAYLIAADAMTRTGDERSAVRALLGGINKVPRSLPLWTALGTALAAHDGGQVSPPARFAFEQATRLAPTHPAPPFFLGLALVRADDYAAARPLWARAVALTPERASYRRDLEIRLALLDGLLAEQARTLSAPADQAGSSPRP